MSRRKKFNRDLKFGQAGEELVIQSFESHGWTAVERTNHARYDFEMHHEDGRMMLVEVKREPSALRWGNVYVEFECRGKPSGISISEADVYVFVIGGKLLSIYKRELLELMVNWPVKPGGDYDPFIGKKVAKGYTVPIDEIRKRTAARDEIRGK